MTFRLSKRQLFRPRSYRKAPVLAVWKQIRALKQLRYVAFTLAAVFLLLSNPFASWQALQKLTNGQFLAESRDLFRSIPQFLRVLPQEFEQNSFAFFDWSSQRLGNFPVFAKNEDLLTAEAGPSAEPNLPVVREVAKPDPATLPFHVEIPKLALYQKVTANVNANDEREYTQVLKEGVAHAKGAAFPGQKKLIYIFGHSTNGIWNVAAYNAVFYQIKDLENDDLIILHLGEESFYYKVSAKEVVKSNDVDYINNKQDQDLLLLQTCWPPGTSWQRIFITALPISAEEGKVLLAAQELEASGAASVAQP